jgi:hypothetical protein
MLTPEKQEQILGALKAKFALEAHNVITDEPLFDSDNDVVDLICRVNADDEQEVVYCRLSLTRFLDSATDGCEDDPVVTLTYSAHLFWEFREKRSDDSSPEKDLIDLILRLRNRFLLPDRDIGETAEHTPLRGVSNIILGTDPLTGVHGFYKDVAVDVVVE